jgi:hypothetical protein
LVVGAVLADNCVELPGADRQVPILRTGTRPFAPKVVDPGYS